MKALKAKAKAAGLWNLFLPDSEHGAGLSNLDYAPLAELMGACVIGPEVFNCNAPDTGNMEVLAQFGTEEQKRRWLEPLLAGDIRSCFGMTEPGVASSDATNMETTVRHEGDTLVINGRKWWTSGACHPKCGVMIVMARDASCKGKGRHAQHSMVLVPMDAPGVRVLRPLEVFGDDDAPFGHAEVDLRDVRVPASSIVLGAGRGFEIAQARLGPGRLHHCMRLIGMAERALKLMCHRVRTRHAFGGPLAKKGVIIRHIAQSRAGIEQARLLVLQAAYMLDRVGNKAARQQIAMIKVVCPTMACRVVDRAIQAHGGAGVSSDFPLAGMYAGARTLRLADGPDEVHETTMARLELRRSKL
eukprot:PLAT3494.1.p1 GENE.PLAT3494.1~~PLAT3494.1.p1  ORF type:complete len:420 (-),score=153.14 PLAT3494.1:203-1276(-)